MLTRGRGTPCHAMPCQAKPCHSILFDSVWFASSRGSGLLFLALVCDSSRTYLVYNGIDYGMLKPMIYTTYTGALGSFALLRLRLPELSWAERSVVQRHERWIYVYGWAAFQRIDLLYYIHIYRRTHTHTLCALARQYIYIYWALLKN